MYPSDSDMIRVGILTFDGVTMLDVAGPAETLCRVSAVVHDLDDPPPTSPDAVRPGYEVVYLSVHGGSVTTSTGMLIGGTMPVAAAGELDTLVVPGADQLPLAPLDPDLLGAVAALVPQARRVATVCTGAFLLAALGFLDGRRATTHWRNASELARRHPRVRVEPDTIHVHDGKFVTSAGIAAGIDLALALVEDDWGPEVARAVARDLVMFLHRPGGQAQYSASLPEPGTDHPVLGPVIEQVLAEPSQPHTVASLAAAAAVSPRHLNRLFRAELGMPPARWLETVRLDRARQLILEGRSVTRTAVLAGFGSDETLRRAFTRHLRTTPTEYRARFATTREG